VLGTEGLLAKLINRNGISDLPRMNLLYSWLILETLSIALDMLGCGRSIGVSELISLHAELCPLIRSKCNELTSSTNIGCSLEFAS